MNNKRPLSTAWKEIKRRKEGEKLTFVLDINLKEKLMKTVSPDFQ